MEKTIHTKTIQLDTKLSGFLILFSILLSLNSNANIDNPTVITTAFRLLQMLYKTIPINESTPIFFIFLLVEIQYVII